MEKVEEGSEEREKVGEKGRRIFGRRRKERVKEDDGREKRSRERGGNRLVGRNRELEEEKVAEERNGPQEGEGTVEEGEEKLEKDEGI